MDAAEETNPLLAAHALPPFSRIEPEIIEPAVRQILAEARQSVSQLLERGDDYDWDNLIAPLEVELDRVSRVWAPVRHLHSVMSNEALRAAYNRCLPLISEFYTELGQHPGLYAAYRQIAESTVFRDLDPVRRKVIDDALRDFRLGGADLPEGERARFAEIEAELAELQSRFEEQVLDATQAWKKPILREEDLSGLGADGLALARAAAEREGVDGWLLTLEFPLFHAVMTRADDRALRREVYRAWSTRASDQGPHAGRWDNGPVMERIVRLRQEKARLLGYANHAELALQTRMVTRPEQVLGFLHDLAGRALPAGRREFDELGAFAAQHLAIDRLEPWDVGYVAEKLRKQRFAISDEMLKPWFPASRVIAGLFAIAGRLFDVSIEAVDGVDVWHPDVRYYRVRDSDGAELGGFYLDLYARRDKRGGAWMDECIGRMRHPDGMQLPVAFLTCNLTPPHSGREALFTHDEVITLFHEFGHGLHHMLTRIDIPSVAGINGVEWDAVELPSQLLENWCWEREALDLISGHVDTGEPLPDELLAPLQRSRHFHAALAMLRQIEFSLFDFRLHLEHEAPTSADMGQLLARIRDQVALIHPPEWNRFAHSFSHIFAGAYAAGYYSYKWAEVLSADAYSVFADHGVLDVATGRRFREAVLARGGSRPAIENFREFRGRDPDPAALLRQAGLTA